MAEVCKLVVPDDSNKRAIIEILESYLERARVGQGTWLFVAMQNGDGLDWSSSGAADSMLTLGCLERAKYILQTQMDDENRTQEPTRRP